MSVLVKELKIQLKGYNYSLEKTFQIPVEALLDIELEYIEAEHLYRGRVERPLTVHISNEGNEVVKELEGRLFLNILSQPKKPHNISERSESKKSKKINFWIDVDEDAKPGSYSLNLSLKYRAWGEEFSESLRVPLQIKEGERLQIKTWGLIPIAILIVAGACALKRIA